MPKRSSQVGLVILAAGLSATITLGITRADRGGTPESRVEKQYREI